MVTMFTNPTAELIAKIAEQIVKADSYARSGLLERIDRLITLY